MLSNDIEATFASGNAMEGLPDETAIELIGRGHARAYEIIMRRYNQRLFRTARSILKDDDAAQDAVQEAYISAYFKLDSYASSGSFGAWLTRITVNEALMIKRKPDNRVADKPGNVDSETLNAPRANPVDMQANKELAGLIETAIDALPDNFRSVFVLRAIQQLSVSETADCLNIQKETVKTRYHRARNLLQENLNQHIQEVGLHAFEFAGQRCDHIVHSVFKRLDIDQDLRVQAGTKS